MMAKLLASSFCTPNVMVPKHTMGTSRSLFPSLWRFMIAAAMIVACPQGVMQLLNIFNE
jgi:hypothetical protein